jgi:hypothetical protein
MVGNICPFLGLNMQGQISHHDKERLHNIKLVCILLPRAVEPVALEGGLVGDVRLEQVPQACLERDEVPLAHRAVRSHDPPARVQLLGDILPKDNAGKGRNCIVMLACQAPAFITVNNNDRSRAAFLKPRTWRETTGRLPSYEANDAFANRWNESRRLLRTLTCAICYVKKHAAFAT